MHFEKAAAAALLTGTTLAMLPLQAADAATAAPFRVTKVQYDSPGSDNRSNASLNAEYLQVKNVTRQAQSLSRWTVRDAQYHVYTFPAVTVAPGAIVTLHTGSGVNGQGHLYWRAGNYVWNNTGDSALLRTPAGATVQTVRWTSLGAGWRTF